MPKIDNEDTAVIKKVKLDGQEATFVSYYKYVSILFFPLEHVA